MTTRTIALRLALLGLCLAVGLTVAGRTRSTPVDTERAPAGDLPRSPVLDPTSADRQSVRVRFETNTGAPYTGWVDGISRWRTNPGAADRRAPRRARRGKIRRVTDRPSERLVFLSSLEPAEEEWLSVSTPDSGTGSVRLPRRGALASDSPIPLRLSGPGVLALQITDSTGAPASGLAVGLRLLEAHDPGSPLDPKPGVHARRAIEGGGGLESLASTDESGRVVVAGLYAEPYVVLALCGDDEPQVIGAVTPRTDGAKQSITFSRPHLLVRAWTVGGARLPAEDVHLAGYAGDAPPELTQPVVLSVHSVDGETGAVDRVWTSQESDPFSLWEPGDTPGVLSFETRAGKDYFVVASGPGLDPEPIPLRWAPGESQKIIDLVPNPDAPRTLLELCPSTVDRVTTSALILVTHRPTGVILHAVDWIELVPGRPNPTWTLQVPSSELQVELRGTTQGYGASCAFDTQDPADERTHGRTIRNVTVSEGERLRVPMSLGRGGRLRIRYSRDPAASVGSNSSGHPDVVRARIVRSGEPDADIWRREASPELEWLVAKRDWPIGKWHTTLVLPAGAFELVATSSTGLHARVPVEIDPDVPFEVDVQLRR